MTVGFFLAVLWAAAAPPVEIVGGVPAGLPTVARVIPLTKDPTPHFFGYYGVCPWELRGGRLACLESNVGDRLVKADDVAKVCLVDAAGKLAPIADTRAWNLQQGAMLHWLPTRELAFNDRGVAPEEDRVKLRCKAGRNELLVKVCNGNGAWGVHVQPLLTDNIDRAFGDNLKRDFLAKGKEKQ